MRNIFLFISRYFNFLIFLLLQVICIYFITRYSKYHQAAFGSISNNITGKVNSEYNKVEYYFEEGASKYGDHIQIGRGIRKERG